MASANSTSTTPVPVVMRAVRLCAPGDPAHLVYEELETPRPGSGEALVRVHAAAITRDELTWPVDRLPAIPSYEFSGVVSAVGPDVDTVAIGDAVYALSGFDRDGAAAEYTVVQAAALEVTSVRDAENQGYTAHTPPTEARQPLDCSDVDGV